MAKVAFGLKNSGAMMECVGCWRRTKIEPERHGGRNRSNIKGRTSQLVWKGSTITAMRVALEAVGSDSVFVGDK